MMRWKRLCVITLLSSSCWAQGAMTPKLAIPSYSAPTTDEWARWQSIGSNIVGLMVMNRNNGDDITVDPATVAAVKKTQAAGIAVLGYVHTGYGKRDSAELRAKIDGVYAGYGVDGIFFDETPTDCAATAVDGGTMKQHYQALADYVRSKPGKHLVVMNPGTMPATDCWMSATDLLITAEKDSLAAYQKSDSAAWAKSYGPSRFWELVYNVPDAATMQQVVTLARQRGVGWLYVTDDGADGNPWNTPAKYLVDEAKAWTGIEPALPALARRVGIQWGGMNSPKTQIFLDSGQKGSRFSGAGSDLRPDLLIQLVDGSAQLLRYTGTGADWAWTEVPAHVAVLHPDASTTRIEFDAESLGKATSVHIRFRLLDKDWNPKSSSKVLTWTPN